MEPYKFTRAKIDEHIVKIGVDIRPVLELKLDHERLYHVGKELTNDYPELFESLVQSPAEFRIMKKFLFTGSREAELVTLVTTPRGLVFIFPKLLSAIGEEIDFDNIADRAVECLQKIKRSFPHKKIIRVGIVNEYIFDTADQDACKIICERFTKFSANPAELLLRINKQTDDYNRIIEMQPLQKIQNMPELSGRPQNVGYGLKVKVDFNNIDTIKELEKVKIYEIIHSGQEYNEKELYDFLNSQTGD